MFVLVIVQMRRFCDACHREYANQHHAFLDISVVEGISVLTTELSLLSSYNYEGLVLLFTPILLTYDIIHNYQ